MTATSTASSTTSTAHEPSRKERTSASLDQTLQSRPDHRPDPDRRPHARARLPPLRRQFYGRLRACRRACRPADAQKLYLQHREGRLRRRLRNARGAREPRRPALAADRAAGHPDPCAFGTPGRPDLPPGRRPRRHEHEVRRRQSVHRQPRRRPRRLPRRRRLRPAPVPGGRVGPRALRRLPRPEVPRCLLERVPLVREAARGKRRRSRRLHTPRTGRRPRGGTDSPRLPPDRPVERKRGHPHRDDLLLALPDRHPPFGDDRRQPTRQLHLAPEDDGRTDRPLRQPLCARRDVPQAHQRSRRDAGTDRRAHAEPLVVLSDQEGQRTDRQLLRTHGDDGKCLAALRTDDPGRLALGRPR